MTADQIKIEIDVETREAITALAKLAASTAAVEKETKKLSLAQKAWAAANADIGQATKGWQEAGSRIATVGAAFAAATAAGIVFAAHVEQQEAKLRRLGSAYDYVVAATNGAVSASQALQLQGQIQAAGVQVSGQQLGLLTRAVREYATATGNDASEAVEKLTNAIVNNSEDALSELNLAQARATTSTQTLANVTRELEARYRGVAPAARTLSEDLAKIPDALTAIGGSAMRAALSGLEQLANRFSETGRAGSDFFRNAARGWRDLVEAGDTLRGAEQQRATDASNADRQLARERLLARARTAGVQVSQNDIRGLSAQQMRQLQSRFETGLGVSGTGQGADLLAAFGSQSMVGSAQTMFDAQLNRVQTEQRLEARAAERRAGTIAGVRLSEMEQGIERKMRKPGESSSGSDALRGVRRDYNRALAEAIVIGAPIVDTGPRAPGQTMEEYWQGRVQAQRQTNEMTREARAASERAAEQIRVEEEQEAENNRQKQEASFSEQRRGVERDRDEFFQRRTRELGKQDDARNSERELFGQSALGRLERAVGLERNEDGSLQLDAAQTGLGLMEQSLGILQSGFAQLWSNIADGSMSAGEAFEQFAAQSLKALGQLAIQEGTAMLFKAIPAAIASPPLGVAYGIGGAGLIALGVGLGAAGASIKPPATPGAASDGLAARANRRESFSGPRDEQLGAVNVTLASLVPAGVVDATRARNGLRGIGRAGMTDLQRRVEY